MKLIRLSRFYRSRNGFSRDESSPQAAAEITNSAFAVCKDSAAMHNARPARRFTLRVPTKSTLRP
jgi:hypothetical protein